MIGNVTEKVAEKANVIQRVGYNTVYVGPEGGRIVCLLTTRNKCPELLNSFTNQREYTDSLR